MKRFLKIAGSVALGALLLWLFFRHLDLREILAHVREADPFWLGVAVLMQGLHLVIRSFRWRTLLSPMKKGIGFYNLFSTTSIGYMLSFLLFRIGEVVRPLLLGQRERISRSGALATCVLERLMDFVTVAFLWGIYLVFRFERADAHQVAGLDIAQLRATGLIFGIATLAAFPVLYVIVHFRQRLFAFFDRRLGSDAALPRLIHAFLGGFDAVKGGRLLTRAWLQSFGVWLSIAGSIWASLRAFDLGVDFLDSFLMVALLAFGIAVPTPGGVGSYEYVGQLGLQFFGVGPNQAAAAILVTHVTSVAPVMVLGFLLVWRDGLSLRGLTGMGEKAER